MKLLSKIKILDVVIKTIARTFPAERELHAVRLRDLLHLIDLTDWTLIERTVDRASAAQLLQQRQELLVYWETLDADAFKQEQIVVSQALADVMQRLVDLFDAPVGTIIELPAWPEGL